MWALFRVQRIVELDGGKHHQRKRARWEKRDRDAAQDGKMCPKPIWGQPLQSGSSVCSTEPASAVQGQCLRCRVSICSPGPAPADQGQGLIFIPLCVACFSQLVCASLLSF